MKLYGALLSPYVRKVALVATEKGLDWTLELTGPGSTDPVFRAISPFGKIPGLDDAGYHLADSTAIVAYLEAKQPEPPLLPADAKLRGRAMWFDEFADTIFFGAGRKVLFNRFVSPRFHKIPGNEAEALEGEAELPEILAYLESVTPAAGWLLGETFSLADYAVTSVLRSIRTVGWGPDAERYPLTAAWYDRVTQRPAWQAVAAIEDAPRR